MVPAKPGKATKYKMFYSKCKYPLQTKSLQGVLYKNVPVLFYTVHHMAYFCIRIEPVFDIIRHSVFFFFRGQYVEYKCIGGWNETLEERQVRQIPGQMTIFAVQVFSSQNVFGFFFHFFCGYPIDEQYFTAKILFVFFWQDSYNQAVCNHFGIQRKKQGGGWLLYTGHDQMGMAVAKRCQKTFYLCTECFQVVVLFR